MQNKVIYVQFSSDGTLMAPPWIPISTTLFYFPLAIWLAEAPAEGQIASLIKYEYKWHKTSLGLNDLSVLSLQILQF